MLILSTKEFIFSINLRKRNLNHQSQWMKSGKVSYTFNLWRDEEMKDNTYIPKDLSDTSNVQDNDDKIL